MVAETIDMIFLTVNMVIVFKIHLGFAFLEGGVVRIKNQQTILFKCMADMCINFVGWWLIGYGIAFGEHGFSIFGYSKFAYLFHDVTYKELSTLLFFWTLMSISTKIVSVFHF